MAPLVVPLRPGDTKVVVLLTVSDIAAMYGVTPGAVCNWSNRYLGFPKPVTTNPRYWRREDIIAWDPVASVLGHTPDRSAGRSG